MLLQSVCTENVGHDEGGVNLGRTVLEGSQGLLLSGETRGFQERLLGRNKKGKEPGGKE